MAHHGGIDPGLELGTLWAWSNQPELAAAISAAEITGGLWLGTLRMTIIPLVVALLVTGIVRTPVEARGGRVVLRSVLAFIGLLWLWTGIAALLVPALLAAWPIPTEAAAALRAGLAQSHEAVAPELATLLRSIVPTNPIAAAALDGLAGSGIGTPRRATPVAAHGSTFDDVRLPHLHRRHEHDLAPACDSGLQARMTR